MVNSLFEKLILLIVNNMKSVRRFELECTTNDKNDKNDANDLSLINAEAIQKQQCIELSVCNVWIYNLDMKYQINIIVVDVCCLCLNCDQLIFLFNTDRECC